MTGSFVVATAGHVDHGKSSLVQALTGTNPDRWAEERRRGLTIDLGFAWTTMSSGKRVAFVDVPGHERFLGNMLAGLGPSPVVCFVVSADEGWSAQSAEHRDALAAFGIKHGLLVISKADRVPDGGAAALTQSRRELADTALSEAPHVVVSVHAGTGLDRLRTTLDDVLTTVAAPDSSANVRLWLDRSFSANGAGTVVTGTLSAGTISRGDHLELAGPGPTREVTVRRLQSMGIDREQLAPIERAAVNLRSVASREVARGDVLLTPGAWPFTSTVDVRRTAGIPWDKSLEQLTVHVGTAAVPARLRALDADHARLTLIRSLPLRVGDRVLLYVPSARRLLGGGHVLDPDPPGLRRRGDAAHRAKALAEIAAGGGLSATLARHGAMKRSSLRRLGLEIPMVIPGDVIEIDEWWVYRPSYEQWLDCVRAFAGSSEQQDALTGGVSTARLRSELGDPAGRFLRNLIADSGLEQAGGQAWLPRNTPGLGVAEVAIATLEARLAEDPFDAPDANELAALGLGPDELAAAERAHRLTRLGDRVVLLPTGPARALSRLAELEQPFTTSAARKALDTTRRVIIPLLEHLDHHGWTRRINDTQREVVQWPAA